MEVKILASGSSGNCIAIRSGDQAILIDAGIARTKIEKRLNEVGIRADQIAAIFITHAHGDHIKGVPLANKYHIPVHASDGEWKGISAVDEDLRRIIKDVVSSGEITVVSNELSICAFKSHHDAHFPLGYTISNGECKVSVCMDTGHVDHEMFEVMKDSDIYIIEANHDPDMVVESNYPLSVQARILSDIGHLSNEQTASALVKLVKGRGERIYLTHLSSSNNMPKLAEMTVNAALRKKGFEEGTHYHLEVL